MNKLNQTLLKFELEQNFTYDDYFVSKCNYFAFSLIESWPKWEKNILNIYGEKFSGKSHLSEIFKKKNNDIIIKTEEINEEFLKRMRFHENIILDNIDKVGEVKIFGGEPVLLDRMWQFLDSVDDSDAKQIDIVMSTNLTQIKYKDWSLLNIDKKFKSLKLMVSCDHYGKQLEFIRYPIDVKQFEQNLQIMKDHIIFIACTVSVLNVFDLKKIEEYYKDFAVSFEPVYSPASLSIKNIPNKDDIDYIPNQLVKTELLKTASDDEFKKGNAYIQALQNYRRGV